ncbi:MAG: DEAD/DEAH box helicase family protein [Candidatus Omnitrophota bacterium]
MLTDLSLKAVYDSSECDLVKDLFCPLLQNSFKYDRGVGFFSSSWLRLASEGLQDFTEGEGAARFIMSPIISDTDWHAIQLGNAARNDAILYTSLIDSIESLKTEMEERPLNALAWLIADEVISIKFAIPTGRLNGGDFHDKYAIFEDENGNKVAIHGSYNDSMHASLNGESFSVFKSWDSGQLDYVVNHQRRFVSVWENQNPLFRVFDIPQAVKEAIIRLRTTDRPYKKHKLPIDIPLQPPLIPSLQETITLWDYQEKAISNWRNANFRGLFEMATGTGKTITSIAGAKNVCNENGGCFLLVSVPYIHLIEQWEKDLLKFDFMPIACSSDHGNWEAGLASKIQDYNAGFRKSLCCLVTHQTASLDNFQRIVVVVKRKPIIGIFDEAHGLGAKSLRKGLLPSVDYRIGLSATPARWFDSEGTQVLMDYFSNVCFSFPLEEAIGKFLCKYHYYPHVVELTEYEFSEYIELSKTIKKAFGSGKDIDDNPYLASLLRARSDLINKAENKIKVFRDVLLDEMNKSKEAGRPFSKVLFYAPVGEHKEILNIVASQGIRAREFVGEIDNEDRQRSLADFASGDLQALVAMKCLDQGVNVPSTETAFILASTTNPIQFIQRRGRILRKFPGKDLAYIHDFVVVPPLSENPEKNLEYKQALLQREMPRFAEFSSVSANEFEARKGFRSILDQFHSLHLFDLKPWDIYKINLERHLND